MRPAAICCLLLLPLVACGRGDDPSVPAEPTTTLASATPEPTPCVLEGASTKTQAEEVTDDVAQVTDVRWDDADGCPRVVFEFQQQVANYEVRYTDDVSDCGSGEKPPVEEWDAEAFLLVHMTPAGGPDPASETGEPVYKGPRDIAVDGPILKHLKVTCDFEAVFDWIVALDEKHPFTVVTLQDPPRLVIDISES
jgi:hypothetical protein